MTSLDALVRLWRLGRITSEDLTPDERRRVHERLLELQAAERAILTGDPAA